MDDRELSSLLARQAPRAPAGFEDRVMVRVAKQQLRRRARMAVLAVAAAATAAAAVWLVAGRLRSGQPTDDFTVAAGAQRELGTGDGRSVLIVGPAGGRAGKGGPLLTRGHARLEGDGASLRTPDACVTALGGGAQVELEVSERRPMTITTKQAGAAAAVAATALTIHVLHGRARVDGTPPAAAHLELAVGDRALLQAGRPPVALRTAHPAAIAVAGGPAPTPAPSPGATALAPSRPQGPEAAPPAGRAETSNETGSSAPGSLDKEVIRAGMQSLLPRLKTCYEEGAARTPGLAGRVVLKFLIRTREGRGRVDEAEVDPSNAGSDGDLNSPLVEQCVLNALAEVEFPAPAGEGEVLVSYPIAFAPAEPDAP
jgi:hypothetical protein